MLWPPLDLWALAFVSTCAIETPIVAWSLRRAMPSLPGRVALGLGLQAATHPALWYAVEQFSPRWLYLVVAESGVTGVEWALLYAAVRRFGAEPITPLRAGGIALLANVTTTLAGLWMVPLFMQWLGYGV